MPGTWAFYVLICMTCGGAPERTVPPIDIRNIENLTRDDCLKLANDAMAQHRVKKLPIDGVGCRNKDTGQMLVFNLP